MTGEKARFTSDRRGPSSSSWTDDSDWAAGVAEDVDVVDGGLIGRPLNQHSESPDSVVDDFEHNDISEFYDGYDDQTVSSTIPTGISIQDGTVYEGSFALEISDISGGDPGIVSWPSSGLDQYPTSGYSFSYRVYLTGGAVRLNFGVPDGQSPRENSYLVNIRSDSDELDAFEINDGSFTELFLESVSVPENEWLKIVVFWQENGNFSAELQDESGVVLTSSPTVEPSTTRTEGGIGFTRLQNTTADGSEYVDLLKIEDDISGTESASSSFDGLDRTEVTTEGYD